MGSLKDGARHWVDVVAAELARVGRAVLPAIVCRVPPAFAANTLAPVAHVHEVLQTRIVIREPLEEIVDRERLCHCDFSYPIEYRPSVSRYKRDNREKI